MSDLLFINRDKLTAIANQTRRLANVSSIMTADQIATQLAGVTLSSEEETAGIVYELRNGTYTMIGYTGTDADIIVPAHHNGVEVTGIDFASTVTARSIKFPKTIAAVRNSFSNIARVIFDERASIPAENINGEFCSSPVLQEIVLPDVHGSLPLAREAFYGMSALKKIAIPFRMESIGRTPSTLHDWEGNVINTLVDYRTEPQTLQAYFNLAPAVVYVPQEAVQTYKNATNWSVLNIQPIPLDDTHICRCTLSHIGAGYSLFYKLSEDANNAPWRELKNGEVLDVTTRFIRWYIALEGSTEGGTIGYPNWAKWGAETVLNTEYQANAPETPGVFTCCQQGVRYKLESCVVL